MSVLDPRFVALVVPFLVTYGLTGLLRRLAPFLGLMDQPDPRKVHTNPTPRAGGLAIFAALVLTWPFLPPACLGLPRESFLGLAGVIVGLGLVDDLRPLPWWIRLVVQALVAVVIVWNYPGLTFPGARFLAGFWLVAMINAFNMLDNMDALSAGTAWICVFFFLLLALVVPRMDWGAVGRLELIALGAIAGFLVHNFPPARIFMGDSGSTLLGLLVGLEGVHLLGSTGWTLFHVLGVLLICAVPVYDQASVVLIRLRQGRSPFHPDRQHLSHRINNRGWAKSAAVFWIHGLGLASGACGMLLYIQSPWVTLFAALTGLAGWLLLAWYEIRGWSRLS